MKVPTHVIATRRPATYLHRVLFARLIRFLTILALAFSPLATVSAAPASAADHHAVMMASGSQTAHHQMQGHDMAEHASMAMAACQDMDGQSKDQPCGSGGSGDCVKACAAVPAVPAMGAQLEPRALIHGPRQLPALISVPHGLVPEAATPPPRGPLKI